MTVTSDAAHDHRIPSVFTDRTERVALGLAVFWGLALLGLVLGAATSNGYVMATSLLILLALPLVLLVVLASTAVRAAAMGRRVSRLDGQAQAS